MAAADHPRRLQRPDRTVGHEALPGMATGPEGSPAAHLAASRQRAPVVSNPPGVVIRKPSRIERVCAGDESLLDLMGRLVDLSRRGLVDMWARDSMDFVHTRHLTPSGELALRGRSTRYSAVVLLASR